MSSAATSHLIALAGNPNVGKSTVFNGLTGLNQHTGNWPGKTVALFQGTVRYKGKDFTFVDLPGTYSLRTNSPEEELAREFIVDHKPDVTVCVVDATSLERNLNLVFQVMSISNRCVLCLNLMDEAQKKGISIDTKGLQDHLGIPVIPTAARRNQGLNALLETVYESVSKNAASGYRELTVTDAAPLTDEAIRAFYEKAESIVAQVVRTDLPAKKSLTERLDDIVTSKRYGILIMLLLLGVVFAITLSLANYPSQALAWVLFYVEDKITAFMLWAGAPAWFHGITVLGVYRTVAWVISVMLPPMAIFFPLFTLLEDFGYLPRVAFNLDHLFKKSGGHGKQALTMSMGFGCNVAGVVSTRIIESPRERLIAILTNNFVPCNGRFPLLITLSSIFFAGKGLLGALAPTAAVTGTILLGVGATFLVSRVLSSTFLKGVPTSFVLELPPYRKPDVWAVLVRSWKDRTVWVLKRAVAVALPCGFVTWILANVQIAGFSLLYRFAHALNPFAKLIGLDGTILTAFIAGFPANEIVIPIALMSYLSHGAMTQIESVETIGFILKSNGWGWTTALSALLFSLLHYPCGTTVYTVYKETGSAKWAFMSAAIPTLTAVSVLLVLNTLFRLVGV